ncbi:NnrS family protein [Pseudahrensia aquimaris]|uniref:NnrS family protein n=1 Tax=Pseudahrensia aquimaris TaxID=744461 RepID=A0ABW3FES3_9HYPH
MSKSSAAQIREWNGPAILSFGFRPFFLFGAFWAALAMVMWMGMLTGIVELPTHLDPVSWHAHEFLFGYLGAIIAGFLLTAVPNWTGRLPVVGWRLGLLFGIWIASRIAMAISDLLPLATIAIMDLAFPILLGALILQEIIAGKNWRNLIVLAMLAAFTLANGIFHWEAAHGIHAAQGLGLRLGLASAIMMICVIGGRIIPSFTRNWLVQNNKTDRPVAPMQQFDKLALLLTLIALLVWVVTPDRAVTGFLLLAVVLLHTFRLARWKGMQTKQEPLLLVLHIAYAMVPLGALGIGVGIMFPEVLTAAAAQHVWMAGAIGLMTLGVMSRATLGHTGQPLKAGGSTVFIYASLIASLAARLSAIALPNFAMELYSLSASLWIAAFGGFVLIYGKYLIGRKQTNVSNRHSKH